MIPCPAQEAFDFMSLNDINIYNHCLDDMRQYALCYKIPDKGYVYFVPDGDDLFFHVAFTSPLNKGQLLRIAEKAECLGAKRLLVGETTSKGLNIIKRVGFVKEGSFWALSIPFDLLKHLQKNIKRLE